MDINENRPYSPSSAGILDGARDVRIERARLNNVAGNFSVDSFSVDSSSNTFIYIRQESGVGFRSVLVLLLLLILVFPLPIIKIR